VIPRAGKVAFTRPYGVAGIAFLYGYFRAMLARRPQGGDVEYRRFVRGELVGRLRRRLRA
jgi:hypothetical protein